MSDGYFWSVALSSTGVLFLLAALVVAIVGVLRRGPMEMVPRHAGLAAGLLLFACLDFVASLLVLVVTG